MNWNNLKNGLCAKCGEKLVMGLLDLQYTCSHCDFRISREKWETITTPKIYRREVETDNLSALNNLGHELVTEDFSD